MSLINSALITTSNDSIYNLEIPYAFDGFERLKQTICSANQYLKDYEADTIEAACFDLLQTEDWFFDCIYKQAEEEVTTNIETDQSLLQYINVKQWAHDYIEALKMQLSGQLDILKYILYDEHMVNDLCDIPHFTTDLENHEYFAVLALFQASLALTALHDFQNEEQDSDSIAIPGHLLATDLALAINSTLDAQLALHQAVQLTQQGYLQEKAHYEQIMKSVRQNIARKGVEGKQGKNGHLRKQKAIELYESHTYKSRRQAALIITKKLRQFIIDNNLQPLKPGAEENTIYRWLTDYDNQNANKK